MTVAEFIEQHAANKAKLLHELSNLAVAWQGSGSPIIGQIVRDFTAELERRKIDLRVTT